jgi:predicted transcriptional regulator
MSMPTIPFTIRLDSGLKAKLEEIAQYEDCSASYIANQAIQAYINEREKTRKLIETGLESVDNGVSISSKAVNNWLKSDYDAPFPEADTF